MKRFFSNCKCNGAGWVWGFELENPDKDTYNDTMTKYTCDRCQNSKIIKVWAWEWGRHMDDMKRILNGRK